MELEEKEDRKMLWMFDKTRSTIKSNKYMVLNVLYQKVKIPLEKDHMAKASIQQNS